MAARRRWRIPARGVYTVTYRATDDDDVIAIPDSVIVAVNQAPMARIDSPGRDTINWLP